MKKPIATLLLVLGTLILAQASRAQSDHVALARDVEEGRVVSISVVLERLRGRLPGYQHIGSEYFPQSRHYRLRFMRGGQVLWIDVDARSGRVVATSSP